MSDLKQRIDAQFKLKGANQSTLWTLRDHFAGLAMQSMLTVFADNYSRTISNKEIAEWSYETADAMLKEREKCNDQKD